MSFPMDNKQMQPQPGGYAPYGFNAGTNAYTPNFPPAGGYPPPPNANAPPHQQPGGYTPYPNAVSFLKLLTDCLRYDKIASRCV